MTLSTFRRVRFFVCVFYSLVELERLAQVGCGPTGQVEPRINIRRQFETGTAMRRYDTPQATEESWLPCATITPIDLVLLGKVCGVAAHTGKPNAGGKPGGTDSKNLLPSDRSELR